MNNKNIDIDDIMDVVGGNQAITYVCFIRDHSGSMKNRLENGQTKAEAAQENFNEYIATLKKESEDMETRVSIVEFDDNIKCTDKHKLIKDVTPMTGYWTGGMTALYDAIGVGIKTLNTAMNNDERKDKAALVIIQTDGSENFSSDYAGRDGQKRLQKEISELEATSLWTFVFLGENIDKKIASDIGMTEKNFMKTEATGASYVMTNNAVNNGLSKYYSMRKTGVTQSRSFFNTEEEDVNNS